MNKRRIVLLISIFFILTIAFLSMLFLGVFRNYDVYKNIKYGENERNTLDLYIPKDYQKEGLLLYIHGGAWIAGDKSTYKKELKTYAKKGIACASINYRYVSGTVSCYDILEDIETAVKVIYEKASSLGIRLNRMMLTGHSAGAHLSLLYAYKYQNTSCITPVAVASFAGPTDLTEDAYYENWPSVYELFSYMIAKSFDENTKADVKEDLLQVSPISYVNENSVPTIIAQGEKDNVVDKENAIRLENVLKSNNVEYYAYYYPSSGHGLENDKKINQQAYAKFDEFVLKYLC